MFKRVAIAFALLALLSGCTSVKKLFGGKEKPNEPAKLVDFTPTAKVSKLWSTGVGKGEERLGLRQAPTIADGHVYAAAVKGGVRALDLQTGKTLWERKSDLRLSGGPGAGGGLVVVGTLSGDVIALDAATGANKWKAKVKNEVITAPVIAQGTVFVRSNDGTVTAFNADTGERKWFNLQDMPTLTVRGNAPLASGPGLLFVGNDDGTLSALAMSDGRAAWEQVVGVPEGRTELDRMSDVDGAPVLDGTTIFASSFKKETVAIDGPSGRPVWTRDHGGGNGVAVSPSVVVVSDPTGSVWALDKSSGAGTWSQAVLARRSLTGPAIQGDYAVVGDFDGYLHWLRLDNGEVAARERAGRKPLKAQPQVVDGILVVQNTDGEIIAFRLSE